MKVKTIRDAEERYGKIENGKWANESKWMGLLDIPERIALGWKNSATGKPTYRIYCNKDMYEPLLAALESVSKRGLLHELKTFNGCFQIRKVRGMTSQSAHSWGLAVDVNSETNGLGCVPTLSAEFVRCFTGVGFDWGGFFKRPDGMHFSFCYEG